MNSGLHRHGASRQTPRIKHFGEEPWDFRLVRTEDGSIELRVVHYDRRGFVSRIDPEPATFWCDGEHQRRELINEIQEALYGARDKPVIGWDAARQGDVK